MTTIKSKVNVGITLLFLFLIVVVTGVILHLKSHGTIIQPRGVIKLIHWIAGLLMAVFAAWHGTQVKKMLNAMKIKFPWFWYDTMILIIFLGLTLLTGLIKLLSPVKIPHLGLWHYWFGIIMTVTVLVHLIRGIPAWIRLKKIK